MRLQLPKSRHVASHVMRREAPSMGGSFVRQFDVWCASPQSNRSKLPEKHAKTSFGIPGFS
jgi:hypothetical protein